MNISIIVEATHISDDSIVCKATGTSEFTLKRKISIYTSKKVEEKIPDIIASDGVVFLVGESGSINCIPEDTKLKVVFDDPWQAKDFLDELVNSEDK